VAGFLAVKLAGIGASPNAIAVPPHRHLIETGARVAALIAMTVIGVILARSRRLQVQELSEKLRLIKADL
jgi:hypothetical protein